MNKKSFFTALFVFMAVLGAKAQTNKVYKADTVIDGNGNKIITVYSQGTFAEGNGNVVTRDFDVNMGGKIGRMDSENLKTNKKCCDEKQKKSKNQGVTF